MGNASLYVWSSLIGVLFAGPAAAQSTTRVSVDSAGLQANAASRDGSISADGRFVAFESAASNLVPQATSGFGDVFVHDRLTGATELVSVGVGGAQADRNSSTPSISADGRFVAFNSEATNLVLGDVNLRRDIFVRDRQTGSTELVSLSTALIQGDEDSDFCSISADGRFVAFDSYASTFEPAGPAVFTPRVFVRDRQAGTTTIVSVSTGGTEADGTSGKPAISADGRFVSFFSEGQNLVAADTNGLRDVFVRDLLSGTTERVSLGAGGVQGNGAAGIGGSASPLSADGRYVAFVSRASNLVALDANGVGDVFLRDRQSATTLRVSVSTAGVEGDQESQRPALSADGRHVAFSGRSSNLVPGDGNGVFDDVFVRDLDDGTTELVSVSTAGVQGDVASLSASISADGRAIAFDGAADNLVANDTNGVEDVFVRERGEAPSAYCSGDGSGTACPCGNAGAPGNGCASSLNAAGANLAASGTPSISGDTFVLVGSGMPDSSALYFQGTGKVASGAGAVFGDGLRCASGTIVRLGTETNAGGTSQYPGAGELSVSVRGHVSSPVTRTYQTWYRNAASFCTPDTFNLTNGLSVPWQP